ncbi:MAG: hybrid-cluster NAD(P)-dependent oxidoreductase [Rhodobacteraceae bacterium]|nr:hybrid-cluster NAD(P)-dependent oxidoreductase [Paracoccaceae bacterium]
MIPLPRENTPVWDGKEVLECVSVIPEAPDVKTYTFRPPSGATFVFRAGQFLTFELPVPGGPLYRTYSISSSPTSTAYVSITVKALPGSVGTRWVLDNLVPGMRLKATGPAGVFHLPRQPDDKYLFLAAGTGVTPLMSMLTVMYERGEEPDVSFVLAAKRPSQLTFRRRLEFMSTRCPGIKLHFVVSEDDPYEVWTGYRGRFNQLMLGLMTPDYLDRHIYCCGPEPFMQTVRDALISLGFDMDKYHQETFAAPVTRVEDIEIPDDVVPSDTATAEIVFAQSGKSATCSETDTILSVAKSAGLNIANGCNFGVCGTCKVKKLEGEVHMVHNGGISEEDIEAGYILTCCSNPIGKVIVDI